MAQGQVSKHADATLEFYRQAAMNLRMYVDLRFKHFTTFMVITGLLGAAAFNVQVLQEHRLYVQVGAIIVTFLFWLIDFRTTEFLKHEASRMSVLETALNEGVPLMLPPPERVRVRSSFATNLLFALVLGGWVGSMFCEFSRRFNEQVQH